VRGVWSPSGFETLIPSVTSKYCLLAALLFYLLPGDLTYVAVAGLFLTMKMSDAVVVVVVVETEWGEVEICIYS